MCRYSEGEAMIRVRKTTRAKLAELIDYFRRAAEMGHAEQWWQKDDGPAAGEVIERLIAFFERWKARRAKAHGGRRSGVLPSDGGPPAK